jgi:hypothetical protein
VSGLWKLPDLWTRKRTRAHKVLGRRQTDAGAHSYHRPHHQRLNGNRHDNNLALAPLPQRYSPPPTRSGRFSNVPAWPGFNVR